jgi:hypothetical protein
MIENQAKQAEEEQLDIEITEDAQEGAPQAQKASNEDELERYTKQVSRRINKLNAKQREAEERAANLERLAMQKEQELQQYRQQTVHYQQSMLQKEEESLKVKADQVDEIYRKAVANGDADLMSKADTLKTELAIQKEKLNAAKARQAAQHQQQPEQYQQYQPEPQRQQQQEVKPTDQALSWHQENPWYGNQEDPEHSAATQLAYFTHFNLLNEGYEADSEDYYAELNNRVYRAYPSLKAAGNGGQAAGKQESRPSVQRVASASVGGRQKSQTKRGVTFTKSEIERLRGLKPHNMSEEQWLQRVAKEKQKIAQREVR